MKAALFWALTVLPILFLPWYVARRRANAAPRTSSLLRAIRWGSAPDLKPWWKRARCRHRTAQRIGWVQPPKWGEAVWWEMETDFCADCGAEIETRRMIR